MPLGTGVGSGMPALERQKGVEAMVICLLSAENPVVRFHLTKIKEMQVLVDAAVSGIAAIPLGIRQWLLRPLVVGSLLVFVVIPVTKYLSQAVEWITVQCGMPPSPWLLKPLEKIANMDGEIEEGALHDLLSVYLTGLFLSGIWWLLCRLHLIDLARQGFAFCVQQLRYKWQEFKWAEELSRTEAARRRLARNRTVARVRR